MAESVDSSQIVCFGVFEVDLAAGQVRRGGRKLRLQEQPFQLLALLLERPGEVVSRERVRERLWPGDTFVDFDQSISTAINKIREALGDSASNPRFVETIPRRGYRFIAPVAGAGAAASVPALTETETPAPAVRNLPSYLTSFVGREQEIRQVERLLGSTRLLTLTGPGGAGKTRLSQRAAREVAGRFPDGVCFVSLAAISDPKLVASAMARALDVAESPGRPIIENLRSVLQSKAILLVLDNFEQVLEAAPVVSDLLSHCPAISALVTSRAALQISGEQEFPVPPLGLPRPGESLTPDALRGYSAVQLFVERARAACHDFALSDRNAPDVAELCRRVDGLPLAIELAAARVKLFSPKALLGRLGRRLDLLTAGNRDAPERHRTLRQAIAWSYDLLEERQQCFFRRLAVFSGGWTMEAAEALCAGDVDSEWDPFEALAALADHSLIRQTESADEEPRFSMLETIREYGLERLRQAGEEEPIRRRHAEYFLTLAEQAEPELIGADQAHWLNRLETEHDNLRAVFAWAQQQGEAAQAERLGAALWRFWIARGHIEEGRQRLEILVKKPALPSAIPERLRALNGLGTLCHYLADYRQARDVLEECVELGRSQRDNKAVAVALTSLGWVYSELSQFEKARHLSEAAQELNRKIGEERGVALALNNLGWIANYVGDCRSARACHEQSLALRRRIGDQRGIAFALSNLAWSERIRGDYARSAELLDEALVILRPLRDRVLLGWTIINRGQLARDQGRQDRAVRILEEGLALWPGGGHPTILAWTQTALGAAFWEQGEAGRGRLMLSRGLQAWKDVHCPWGVALNLWEQGEAVLGRDPQAATARFQESLRIRGQIGDRLGVAGCLEALAQSTASRANRERCLELLAAANGIRESLEAPLAPRRREELKRLLHELRLGSSAEEIDQALGRGSELPLKEAVALGLSCEVQAKSIELA